LFDGVLKLAGELQEHPMCDYSLEHIASRPAAVADRLISTNFHNTITRGFSAAGDLDTAICLRPGTEIAFDQEPRYEHPVTHQICLAPSRVARFRQINMRCHTRITTRSSLPTAPWYLWRV
jgi:hypothetical protein